MAIKIMEIHHAGVRVEGDAALELVALVRPILELLLVALEAVGVGLHADRDRPGRLVRVDVVKGGQGLRRAGLASTPPSPRPC